MAISRMNMERQLRNMGGLMTLEEPRQGFFLGDIVKKAKINHLGGKSHSNIYETEIEFSRNWHWMWSKFYFNKKHYGLFVAIKNIFLNFVLFIIISS